MSGELSAWPLEGRPGHVPTTGYRAYGYQRPSGPHGGIDLPAREGTPVRSPCVGVVVGVSDDAQADCGFGVTIRDSDGRRWTFCHFRAMPVVMQGERVAAGDLIGSAGQSGNARAPHLHITLRSPSGERLDPTPELLELRERLTSSPTTRPGRRNTDDDSPVGVVVGILLALAAVWRGRRGS